jgi:hypothetical protein
MRLHQGRPGLEALTATIPSAGRHNGIVGSHLIPARATFPSLAELLLRALARRFIRVLGRHEAILWQQHDTRR